MRPIFLDHLFKNRNLPNILLFSLAFLFYLNTIPNEYALDDAIVITKNEFTKQGVSGIGKIFTNDSFTGFFGTDKKLVTGGRYRPLSIASFSIEYELFGLNPHMSHLINILIYAITGIIIFGIIKKLPINNSQKIGFFAALLFIIHPVHSEVVANIKGRDELLALLFSLFALFLVLIYLKDKQIKWTILAGVMLFLGLMSKENSTSFLIIIPATLLFFYPKEKFKIWVNILFPLAASTILYLIIRFSVIGINSQTANELMNNPFLGASLNEKTGTIFYTLLIYIKLLIFPHPLTYDYYPYHIPLIPFFNFRVIVSIIIYAAIIVYILVSIKKKSILGYSLILFLFPLLIVSNLLFTVGTFMNERFIYFSSLGFCLIIANLLVKGLSSKKFSNLVLPLTILLVVASSFKTISRNKVWYNDYTLFTTDVKTSTNSAKSNCTAGGAMLERAQTLNDSIRKKELLSQSIDYLQKSVSIYPEYIDALLLLGNAYWERDKNYEKTWEQYNKVLKRNPSHSNTLSNSKIVISQINDITTKHLAYKRLENYLPVDYDVLYNIGHLKGRYFQQIDSSIFYLNKAVKINPRRTEAFKDLGVAYGIKGELQKSLTYLKKALELNTNDKQLYINIGVTYQRLGNLKKADEFFKKANKLNN